MRKIQRSRKGTTEVYGRSVDSIYIDGNTVRRVEKRFRDPDLDRSRAKRRLQRKQGGRKALVLPHMSFAYICFVILAVAITAAVCIWYVRLRSEITKSQKEIAKLESTLSELTHSNDEEYERIMASVDLEQIKKTAMNDLGMRYPDQDQVISISGADDDYVRQVGSIPEN